LAKLQSFPLVHLRGANHLQLFANRMAVHARKVVRKNKIKLSKKESLCVSTTPQAALFGANKGLRDLVSMLWESGLRDPTSHHSINRSPP